MGNDEDEEPVDAEVPRARMNLKNPTSREKQEHEDSGHAVYRSWCAACVEGRGVGGQHRNEQLEDEIVALDNGFMTQEISDTLPTLICRDSRYGQKRVTFVNGKVPQHTHFISCWFHQRSWSQNHFAMR